MLKIMVVLVVKRVTAPFLLCYTSQRKLSAFQKAEKEKDNSSLETVLTEMKAKVAKVGEAERYFKRALKNIIATR